MSHVSPDELRPVFLGVLFDTVQSSVLPSCLLDAHSCHRHLDTQRLLCAEDPLSFLCTVDDLTPEWSSRL